MKENIAKKVGALLTQKNKHLVTAESCTGGLLSNMITDIPGSSDYYIGGVNTYSYSAKRKLLQVQAETLEEFGAVSSETVREMAIGVRKLFVDDVPLKDLIGISISGIAGPGGGMPGKPVGLVWVGLSAEEGTWAYKRIWDGDRIQNKKYSSIFALELLKAYLLGELSSIRGEIEEKHI